MTASEARNAIAAILKSLPDSSLPKWTDDHDCIWFESLGRGWICSSAPEQLAKQEIQVLFAAEVAGRELVRRAAVPA